VFCSMNTINAMNTTVAAQMLTQAVLNRVRDNAPGPTGACAACWTGGAAAVCAVFWPVGSDMTSP